MYVMPMHARKYAYSHIKLVGNSFKTIINSMKKLFFTKKYQTKVQIQ